MTKYRLLTIAVCLLALLQVHGQAIPQEGLLSRYPFDGNANDTGPSLANGTMIGTLGSTDDPDGVTNGAMVFGQVGSRVEIPTSAMNLDAGTIAMWVRPDEPAGANTSWVFFDTWGTPGERILFWKGEGGGNGPNLIAGVAFYNDVKFDISNWQIGQWYHITMTWRAKNDGQDFVRIYIDGTEVDSLTGISKQVTNIGATANIGARFETNNVRFPGALDDLVIYNRALDPEEVRVLAGYSQGWILGRRKVYVVDDRVGIGTGDVHPDFLLTVDGNILAEEIKVQQSQNWPDYVFDPDYNLRSLEEVQQYIQANHHLPEVPSAAQVESEGLMVGEMNAVLLKKIEELTLYQIQLLNKLSQQSDEIETLQTQVLHLLKLKENEE